jgi:hypothetical protein
MLRRVVAVAAFSGVAVLVGACMPSAPSPSGPVASADPSPFPSLSTEWAERPMYTCGGDERFPPEVIVGQGTAESEDGLAGDALRAFLASPDGIGFPAMGWHRAFETQTQVVFVAPGNDESPWMMVSFSAGPTGTRLDRWGTCAATIALPDTVGNAAWWIDPNGGPIDAGATTIPALIRERACAGGRSPEGRVLEPVVSFTDDAVIVVFGVASQDGPQTCPSNPAFSVTIELSEPLGDRVLLDGGSFPPRDATIPVD